MPAPPLAHVLLVEDDEDLLEVLKYVIEEAGYKVTTAPSGALALSAADTADAFDLVVLDISMSDMGGIEVARRLRSDPRTSSLLIAFHTGLEESEVRAQFADYDLFVSKTEDPQKLLAGIAKVLARPRQSSEVAQGQDRGPFFTLEEAGRAQAALRKEIGLDPRSLDSKGLAEILRTEIAQLQAVGRSSPEVLKIVSKALGYEVNLAALAPIGT